ncbi:hypothetical protein [Actinopolymorpha singaporensis]|nr:hypothetical protein [Actinopolymorpha singaporensis]
MNTIPDPATTPTAASPAVAARTAAPTPLGEQAFSVSDTSW